MIAPHISLQRLTTVHLVHFLGLVWWLLKKKIIRTSSSSPQVLSRHTSWICYVALSLAAVSAISVFSVSLSPQVLSQHTSWICYVALSLAAVSALSVFSDPL
ncbi:hypothetical protein GGU10DRAFT_133104 [Lentinula aff. detonsa]|uniref:Uncharacterized protein n=1 Tax=Lentinula aff. detonsa TaxID=2804958 RepID=A0AA38L1Y3_9AGAR|nr:hypothetical protein GGU10DRAFT_133104 [Lentinula aff. detonsa]